MQALYDEGYDLKVFPGYIEKRGNFYSMANLIGVESKGGSFYEILIGTYTITVEVKNANSFLIAMKSALNG